MVESSISFISSSVSTRVARASARRLEPAGRSPASATWSRNDSSRPAWTKVGASSQPSASPWASNQSPELVLAIGGLASGSRRRRLGHLLDRALLRARISGLELAAVQVPPAIEASLWRIPATRSRSSRGGPHGRGRRIVEFVGQPGRQRAQGQQPLALPDGLLRVLGRRRTALRAGAAAIGNHCAHQLGELVGRQDEESRRRRLTRIELL